MTVWAGVQFHSIPERSRFVATVRPGTMREMQT
jgi:hypothetical protein